jgi:hypothetical protein
LEKMSQEQEQPSVMDDPPHVNHSFLKLLLTGKQVQVHAQQHRLVHSSALRQRLQQNLHFGSQNSQIPSQTKSAFWQNQSDPFTKTSWYHN